MGPNTVVSTRPRSWGLSMVCYHWGSRSPETACVSAPASRLGGGAPGFWQYDRRREAAAGAAALVSRQWNPPPTSQNNNNMTIRRIYNKMIIVLLIWFLRFIWFCRHRIRFFCAFGEPIGMLTSASYKGPLAGSPSRHVGLCRSVVYRYVSDCEV